jgi:hypothetical protein
MSHHFCFRRGKARCELRTAMKNGRHDAGMRDLDQNFVRLFSAALLRATDSFACCRCTPGVSKRAHYIRHFAPLEMGRYEVRFRIRGDADVRPPDAKSPIRTRSQTKKKAEEKAAEPPSPDIDTSGSMRQIQAMGAAPAAAELPVLPDSAPDAPSPAIPPPPPLAPPILPPPQIPASQTVPQALAAAPKSSTALPPVAAPPDSAPKATLTQPPQADLPPA